MPDEKRPMPPEMLDCLKAAAAGKLKPRRKRLPCDARHVDMEQFGVLVREIESQRVEIDAQDAIIVDQAGQIERLRGERK